MIPLQIRENNHHWLQLYQPTRSHFETISAKTHSCIDIVFVVDVAITIFTSLNFLNSSQQRTLHLISLPSPLNQDPVFICYCWQNTMHQWQHHHLIDHFCVTITHSNTYIIYPRFCCHLFPIKPKIHLNWVSQRTQIRNHPTHSITNFTDIDINQLQIEYKNFTVQI